MGESISVFVEGLREMITGVKRAEDLLRSSLPEVELSQEELAELDATLIEMRKGSVGLSLDEFNKRCHA